MKFFYLLLCLALVSACKDKNDDPTEIVLTENNLFVGNISVKTSSEWFGQPLQGTDSEVGFISNKKDTLYYDLGWYNADPTGSLAKTHTLSKVTVNGKKASIWTPVQSGTGWVAVYIKLGEYDSFLMYGTSSNPAEVVKIFKTVQFKNF